MTTFVSICGWLSITCVLVMATAVALMFLGTVFENCLISITRNAAVRERHEIAERYMDDSHWFSEDVPTANLLMRIGRRTHSGVGDVSEIREQWRRDRAALAPTEVH